MTSVGVHKSTLLQMWECVYPVALAQTFDLAGDGGGDKAMLDGGLKGVFGVVGHIQAPAL